MGACRIFTRSFSNCNSCCSKNPVNGCRSNGGVVNTDCPKCWSCPHQLSGHSSLFCKSCGVLQPPARQNYFALFGLPTNFDIDLKQLETSFHALQIKLHPDVFGCKTPTEQKFSLEHAANLNDSYSILVDPLSRSRYLLSLIDESLISDSQTVTNTVALFEIMEYQELVQDTSDPDELISIFKTICMKKDVLISQLSAAYVQQDTAVAVDLTNQLSYIYTLKRILLEKIPGDYFSKYSISPIL